MHESILKSKTEFEKVIKFLINDFSGLQTGRASSAMVAEIMVDSYGQLTPLKHVANISTPTAQEIFIEPWDKSQIQPIEKAIRDKKDLGLNPSNNGTTIIIKVPPLTEERRKDIVKIVHQKSENAKVSVRQIRHNIHETIKKEEKDKLISEDEFRTYEKELQKEVDDVNKNIDELTKNKEKDIMTI